MRIIVRTSRVIFLALLGVAFCAAPALAVPQWSPTTGTERAHTYDSGQPGIEWDTGGPLAGGQISYDSGTELLTVTGLVDTLNSWDVANGGCPTDVGSNCPLNYSPGLDLTVSARFKDITISPLSGNFVYVDVNFETTGAAYDLLTLDPVEVDPDDIMLTASFVAGEFNGNPTSGLSTRILYDIVTLEALWQDVDVAGFLEVSGGHHASLFAEEYFGLALTNGTNFDDGAGGGLNEIVAAYLGTGTLPSFTAEADGQAFRIASGQFIIPEPSTALLLGLGLKWIAVTRRRS